MKRILVLISLLTLFASVAFAGLPAVHIKNRTSHHVRGVVTYLSGFCKKVGYKIPAHGTWHHSRGVCLITGITVQDTKTGVWGLPYASSGTSYSQFKIVRLHSGELKVKQT